ncbi:hypothetical protein [Rhodobacter sp. NSM]|uniref:hypothetical protein n=1 Tax=Rhodobacter sp. NSM TaxID=3457501 RepID=UPI003FD430CE
MKMTDDELTRQEEDLAAPSYEAEEQRDRHDFGNSPEVAGAVLTLVLTWLLFAFTG